MFSENEECQLDVAGNIFIDTDTSNQPKLGCLNIYSRLKPGVKPGYWP